MSNRFWFWFNVFAGVGNMTLALTVASPKWFTIVCIGLSFFTAGLIFGMEDDK